MSFTRQAIKLALSATVSRRLLLTCGDASVRPFPRPGCLDADGDVETRIPLALTFDDGPHPEWTPQLLDRLQESEMTGTFFVIGELARGHPQLVRRIVAEGHELGNHTYTHGDPDETPTSVFLDEVRQTRELLEDIAGVDVRIMRPPKGRLSMAKLLGLWKQQHTVVLWNVEPRDHDMNSIDEMQEWCADYRPLGGDVVLMHEDRPYTLHALKIFAAAPEFADVHFVRISDWLSEPEPVTTLQAQASRT